MSNEIKVKENKKTIKDFSSGNPRWCAGCGDFSIIASEKRFLAEKSLLPENVVNVSGIGCSGRAPYYINTYGVHAIHGRAIPVALGLAITRPELKLFIHSGDGDAISIGCGHLVHGINKNFNCVFLLYDNQIYALTKNQSSPTTKKDHKTNTQPFGTLLDAIVPVKLALGIGGSFVASTADWMPEHLTRTIEAAYNHKGFAFVHILQRCPHFDPDNFDTKSDRAWFGFLDHEKGIKPYERMADKAEIINHDPSDIARAFQLSASKTHYFGLYHRNEEKPRYDDIVINLAKNSKKKTLKDLFAPLAVV